MPAEPPAPIYKVRFPGSLHTAEGILRNCNHLLRLYRSSKIDRSFYNTLIGVIRTLCRVKDFKLRAPSPERHYRRHPSVEHRALKLAALKKIAPPK